MSKHHRLVAELVRQLDDIVNLRRNSPNELFIDATDGGATVLDLAAIAKAVEMPSKKKLRKRYRKLEDRYENLYSKFQDAGREAWEAGRVHDKAVKELRELQTAARELVHACDVLDADPTIAERANVVRDMLPEIRGMSAEIVSLDEARDWTDDLPDEAPKLAEAVKKARENESPCGSWTVTADGKFVPMLDPYNGGRPVVHEVKPDENNSIIHNEHLLDSDPRFRRANPSSQDTA